MKTKITITYDTNTVNESDDVLTQIGLLLINNIDKLNEYEVEHEVGVE